MKHHSGNDEPASFSQQLRSFLRRNLTWFLAAALAFVVLQDVFGTHGIVAMRRSQQEAIQVQKEIDLINQENLQMQGRIQKLKSDPGTIERIAREEMGLARPGDYIFKLSAKPGDAPASTSQQAAPSPEQPVAPQQH